jgi:hypothetical protein
VAVVNAAAAGRDLSLFGMIRFVPCVPDLDRVDRLCATSHEALIALVGAGCATERGERMGKKRGDRTAKRRCVLDRPAVRVSEDVLDQHFGARS